MRKKHISNKLRMWSNSNTMLNECINCRTESTACTVCKPYNENLKKIISSIEIARNAILAEKEARLNKRLTSYDQPLQIGID